LPLSANTTPTCPEEGMVRDIGVTELVWNISSEPDGPMSERRAVARTTFEPSGAVAPSLTKMAAADVGSGFGTAIGKVPFAEISCSSATRACALSFGTMPPANHHGRSVSVIFTSTYFAEHGAPFG